MCIIRRSEKNGLVLLLLSSAWVPLGPILTHCIHPMRQTRPNKLTLPQLCESTFTYYKTTIYILLMALQCSKVLYCRSVTTAKL